MRYLNLKLRGIGVIASACGFLFLLLILPYSELASQGSPGQCLSMQQILNLLGGKASSENIISQVKQYHVQFKLDWRSAVTLARSGADDALLEAIDNNFCAPQPIYFREWYPYSDLNVNVSADKKSLTINGQYQNFPGYTTQSVFEIGERRTLVVNVGNTTQSIFSNDDKMLKIIAGANQTTLICKNSNALSSTREFIYRSDGSFEYTIPDNFVQNGRLTGLGFVIGPGSINNLMISISFQY